MYLMIYKQYYEDMQFIFSQQCEQSLYELNCV